MKCTAVLLAAGTGSRMKSNIAKQYMMLCDKPVIWYGLQAFEQSEIIDDCILVVGKGEIAFVQNEIIEKYGFTKVRAIVEGGAERFLSVKNALDAIVELEDAKEKDHYIFIHDGARPLVTEQILRDTLEAAASYGACCAAMPVKDTIKVVDAEGFAIHTPDRSTLYAVQTPQTFAAPLILEAYEKLIQQRLQLEQQGIKITDDAMVVEHLMHHPIKMVESSYENIKITTPEDLEVAKRFLESRV